MKERLLLVLLVLLFSCSSFRPPGVSQEAGRPKRTPEPAPKGLSALPHRPAQPSPPENEGSEQENGGYAIVKQGERKNTNWLGLDEYFTVHYLYTDIFYHLRLHKRFGLGDKIRIVAGLLYNLDFDNPVNLVIEGFLGGQDLVVSLQLIRVGDQLSLLLATNYDARTEKIVKNVRNLARTYKRSYLILDNRMIALTDLYNRNEEDRLIAANRAEDLARFYIFDGKRSNDTLAEGLLIGSIREAKSADERSLAQITLSHCYMAQGRLREAELLLLAAERSRSEGRLQDERLRDTLALSFEVFLITQALKDHRVEESLPYSL